jgi:serine/threonine protein kinase
MAEMYPAKDQKLGRDVAIKILPQAFAKDAERVARFRREARLLAFLNRPNIAAIYALEAFDGTDFLVLELAEGTTLADRIKSGPPPVGESLKRALQIAEALEAAHEKGVIHRDLKPANIRVTPEGKKNPQCPVSDTTSAAAEGLPHNFPAADADHSGRTPAGCGNPWPGACAGLAPAESATQALALAASAIAESPSP